MKWCLLWLGYVAGTLALVNGASALESPQASIRVEVQMVSVSTKDALTLVPALSDEKTIDDANARLTKMIANEEATLLGWPVLWLRSGFPANRRAFVKSPDPTQPDPPKYEHLPSSGTVEELRYPTEFNPPQTAGGFGRNRPIRPTWGEIIPTTFETRNLGCDLEARAEVNADGSVITLSLASSFIRLRNFVHFPNQTSPLGIGGELIQPRFLSSSARSTTRVRNGKVALLSVFVLPKAEPRVEISLVRAKATLLNASDSNPPKK